MKINNIFLINFYKICFFIIPLWLIIGYLFTATKAMALIFCIIFAVMSYYKPTFGVFVLLALLPIFGGKPNSEQTHFLILLTSVFALSNYKLFLKNIILYFKNNHGLNILLFFITIYCFSVLLSLVGLPVLGLVQKTLKENYLYIFNDILTVGETTLFSSFQSSLYSIQAILLAFWIFLYALYQNKNIFKISLIALLIGFFISLFFGYLDYFNFYNLSFLRAVDSASVNRFSSFFSNSTWYSQYLILSMPLLILMLNLKINSIFKISAIIILMIISEVALILSMQRGGWVTYPIILFVIWLAIYYSSRKDKKIKLSSFLEKNWIKVVATIPFTILLSVYIVFAILDYQKNHDINAKASIEKTTKRAQKLLEANERLNYVLPALKLWSLNPIFGGGGDSFGWQYKIYFVENNAPYKDDKINTLKGVKAYGTAHNMYLQTLVGKGVFGFFSLIGILITFLFMLTKTINLENTNFLKIKALSITTGIVSAIIYGNVQEIFYSQVSQIVFWVYIFCGLFLMEAQKSIISFNYLSYIAKTCLYILPIHIFNITYIKDLVIKDASIQEFISYVTYIITIIAIYKIFTKKEKLVNVR